MTSQTTKQTIAIQILTNISRRKDNQTMKFGQLAEHKWESFFLKSHTQNMVEKLFPDSFLGNQNWAYFWVNSLYLQTVGFHYMSSWGLSKYFQTKLQTSCFYFI